MPDWYVNEWVAPEYTTTSVFGLSFIAVHSAAGVQSSLSPDEGWR